MFLCLFVHVLLEAFFLFALPWRHSNACFIIICCIDTYTVFARNLILALI